MSKTKIEWTDAVWNPVTGCTKVSAGCKNCYAERVAERQIGTFAWNPSDGPYRKFTDVRCHPERLEQPLHWKKPRRVFVNSMSDLFHEAVQDEFLHSIFGVMGQASWHTFQVLTKRAARMQSFMQRFIQMPGLFPNVWLGVSCEDQATADERIPLLLQTPAAVRFVSLEPMLGQVTILKEWRGLGHRFAPQADDPSICCCGKHRSYHIGLDWVIVGGESGPKARPMHPGWVLSVRNQCQAAGVPFFFKQWGEWTPEHGAFVSMCERRNRRDYDFSGKEMKPILDGENPIFMWRAGKKAAGRLLDDREWNEMPSIPQGNPPTTRPCEPFSEELEK